MKFLVQFVTPLDTFYKHYDCDSVQECDELAELDELNDPQLFDNIHYSIYVDVEKAHNLKYTCDVNKKYI